MPRVLLLLPTATYRAADFVAAAARLGVEVVVGSEHRQALSRSMSDRAVVVPLDRPGAAVEAIAALHRRAPLDAVVAVDDQGVLVAASAGELVGFPHNPPDSVSATRDKAKMRRRLAAASVSQPRFVAVAVSRAPGSTGEQAGAQTSAQVVAAARAVGYPCVVKPVDRAASQGVIRADDDAGAAQAARRILAILGGEAGELLVEEYVAGPEVALEGLLRAGRLHTLAIFDKPDPMDGPFFEETIYVTPSAEPGRVLRQVEACVASATTALGLVEGPVHAEVRLAARHYPVVIEPVVIEPVVIEVAARSIGGLCGRALRFSNGRGEPASLEEIILGHALGLDLVPRPGTRRALATVARTAVDRTAGGDGAGASGVMMLPIRAGGVLEGVSGVEEAREVVGITGVEISVAAGRPVVPLPEGGRYLGFLFARGPDPASVVAALRQAEGCLHVNLRPGGEPPARAGAGTLRS